MAAPAYTTDLTLIDDAEAVANYTALGGGASGLSDETDYYIENSQCVSKAGFTGATKGFILNTGTRTVASGDAIFVWSKQNNRNLVDSQANGGIQVLIGDSTTAYDQFYVDGNDSPGSDLAGWRTYAVDPTATPSTSTGSPTTTDRVGMLWKVLGSGSLKGNPNALDVSRHGREIQCANGDVTNGYATFLGAGAYDAATARRWGLLTPVAGGYQFHGCFVMGLSGTAVDFRDEGRNIVVLEDEFVSAGFNEFEIRNASSNVEWTNIIIQHLGSTAPAVLTLNVGTFTGDLCQFYDCATTTFNSDGSSACTNTTWDTCGQIILNEADISGSSVLTSTVGSDEGAIYDNRTTTATATLSEYDGLTISKGSASHHAIRFGTGVTHDITLRNIEFTGFGTTADATDATVRFDATSGSLQLSLTGCTVNGSPASASNFSVDDAAGITVSVVFDTIPLKVTVTDSSSGSPIQFAHVYLHKSGDTGTVYFSDATDVNGEVNDSIAYPGDTAVVGWVRQMDLSGTDYTPKNITGTITSSGLDIEVELDPL